MRTLMPLIGLALVGVPLVPALSFADCYDYAGYTQVVSTVNLPFAIRVAVSGDYAYVANGSFGLQVVDISDPESPRSVASLQTPGFANDVTVSGAYAYVADWTSGVQVVDISDPRWPRVVAHAATMHGAVRVAVSGDRAYVGEYSNSEYIGTLEVIDVTNPLDPRAIGEVDVPHALSEISGVAIQGTYAYVAASTAGLQVVDVSVPENPRIVGSIEWSSHATDVAVRANHAFVATGGGVKVVDVANPEGPVLVAELHGGYAYAISITGTQAYVAGGGGEWPPYGFFQAIDIADPQDPAVIGGLSLPEVASSSVLSGRHVYAADGGAGLQVIAVAQLVDPPVAYNVDTLGSAEAFALAGDYAYVSDEDALRIIDLSDPSNGRIVGSAALPPSIGSISRLAVAGGHAYIGGASNVSGHYTYHLRVVDVSDPQNPGLVGEVQTPTFPYQIAVSGSYAYLAGAIGDDLYPGALQVVNVADPENPVVGAGIVLGDDRAYDIAISETHAYISSGMSFHVVDIADPVNPRLVTSLTLPQYVETGLALTGTIAYLAYDAGGLCVIDLADPEAPQVIGSLGTEARACALSVSDPEVYMVGEKLQIFDVTNPQVPAYTGRLDNTPGAQTAVAVRDPYVFFTRSDYYGASGLTIVPVQCLPTSGAPYAPAAPSAPEAAFLEPLRCIPNPSSSGTRIHLSARNGEDAVASIYDASGRLVRQLSRRVLSAGDRDLWWDGRSTSGREVASGVYLVETSTGRGTETARIVILR